VKAHQFTLAAVANVVHREFAIGVVRSVSPTRSEGFPSRRRASVEQEIPGTDVFTASWCCSVGTTWTVELRSADDTALGRPVEWICSGVPTDQPTPERQTADLLGERGLLLFPASPVDSVDSPPRTRSRRLIGYVTRNSEVIRLAMMLRDVVDAGGDHPMVVAARWIQAGYSPEVAARWILGGVNWPKVAQSISRRPSPVPN
jgi:hypothetical protein